MRFILMNKSTACFLILLLALAACSPQATPAPDQPVSSGDPNSTPAATDWQPQPGDDRLVRSEVQITGTEIFTLESFPPQFMVALQGSKPTPCHQIRAVIGEIDETHSTIAIEVYAVVDAEAICAQVIEDFEINLPLGSLPSGQYTLTVNGAEIGQIVAP